MPMTLTATVHTDPCVRAEAEPAPRRRMLESQGRRRHEHPNEHAYAHPRQHVSTDAAGTTRAKAVQR